MTLLSVGQTPANDAVRVDAAPIVDLGVDGTLLGSTSGSLLTVDIGNLLGLDQAGLLDLQNLLSLDQTELLDLGGLMGGQNDFLELGNLLGSTGAGNLGQLLNLSGTDSSLANTGISAVGDLLDGAGNVTIGIGDTLHDIGIDITHYHIPGPSDGGPTNPPPSTGSAGVQIFHTVNGDVLIGTSGNDTMTGNVGNDHFFGLGGNDTIDGGAGVDTAFYRGPRSDFTVNGASGSLTVTDTVASRDGTDSLKGVERIAFTDSTLAFDINGDAGQGYRLYQAAFDRTPDQGGLSYWVHRLDGPETLVQIANQFVVSGEFQARYGANSSNATFINALYENVLDRSADGAGQAYWQNAMAKGMGRGEVLASFSESAENHAKVDPGLAHGIALDYGVFV